MLLAAIEAATEISFSPPSAVIAMSPRASMRVPRPTVARVVLVSTATSTPAPTAALPESKDAASPPATDTIRVRSCASTVTSSPTLAAGRSWFSRTSRPIAASVSSVKMLTTIEPATPGPLVDPPAPAATEVASIELGSSGMSSSIGMPSGLIAPCARTVVLPTASMSAPSPTVARVVGLTIAIATLMPTPAFLPKPAEPASVCRPISSWADTVKLPVASTVLPAPSEASASQLTRLIATEPAMP